MKKSEYHKSTSNHYETHALLYAIAATLCFDHSHPNWGYVFIGIAVLCGISSILQSGSAEEAKARGE